MIVSCPKCSTRYNLSPESLGAEGKTVRCIKCEHTWHQDSNIGSEKPSEGNKPPVPPVNKTPEIGSRSDIANAKAHIKKRILVGIGVSFAVVAIVLGIIILAKEPIMAQAPQMGWFYKTLGLTIPKTKNTTGLKIENVQRFLEEENHIVTLVFKGDVVNTNKIETVIPKIKVTLLNKQGVTLDFWYVHLNKATLKPGERTKWICRFFRPPLDDISEHDVSFEIDPI